MTFLYGVMLVIDILGVHPLYEDAFVLCAHYTQTHFTRILTHTPLTSTNSLKCILHSHPHTHTHHPLTHTPSTPSTHTHNSLTQLHLHAHSTHAHGHTHMYTHPRMQTHIMWWVGHHTILLRIAMMQILTPPRTVLAQTCQLTRLHRTQLEPPTHEGPSQS